MAIYAIGDLQGCYSPFRRLLDKLKFDPAKDRLWLTGDLVNRGPHSLKTLRYVHSLGDAVTTVLGNHDLHLLALGHDVRYSGAHYDSMRKILTAKDGEELLFWLRHRPLAHYDKKINSLLVHAGVPPYWSIAKALRRAAEIEKVLQSDKYLWILKHMYGNQPRRWSGGLSGAARARFIVNAFTRMRMIYPDGRMNFTHSGPPDKAGRGMIPWFAAENPRWAGTRIVFGHWSALGLAVDEQKVSLDTGCVWGRQLTAVKLTKKAKVKQVQCG
ncbi:MAG: symmetrical bis(5'-nucleosyl)-tetraphosphatase [Pseudomonadota bacterium]